MYDNPYGLTPEDLQAAWDQSKDVLIPMILAVVAGLFLILLLHILFSYVLFLCYESIPVAHRKRQSWEAFMLLVPLAGYLWNFFVYPDLARGFRSYREELKLPAAGDCGEAVGRAYAICSICAIIPVVGLLFALVAMVLQLVYLSRVWTLRKEVQAANRTEVQPLV